MKKVGKPTACFPGIVTCAVVLLTTSYTSLNLGSRVRATRGHFSHVPVGKNGHGVARFLDQKIRKSPRAVGPRAYNYN